MIPSPLMGLLGVLLTAVGARMMLHRRMRRRQAAFADQLSDTLQLLSGSLRAGYSVLQAIDAVAREADSPTNDEFRRLVVETRLGRELHDTLSAMADRTGSEDFRWVVEAIEIHREVGGNLADVLASVAGTIRERNRIRGQIKTLSAEGRISGYILLALPFVIALGVQLLNPSYMGILFDSGVGKALIGLSFVLMTVGALWMRKIVRLVF